MSCIYSNINGRCTLYDGSIEMPGVNEEGYCICEDDEDPLIICEDYNSGNSGVENNDDLDLENEEE